jgi:hypothetical protein
MNDDKKLCKVIILSLPVFVGLCIDSLLRNFGAEKLGVARFHDWRFEQTSKPYVFGILNFSSEAI